MGKMMRHHADRRIAVGGLISAALFLAMVTIIIVSGEEGLLRSKYTLRTKMDQINGLQIGAPVWLSGVNVGSVSDIKFIEDDSTGKTRIEVSMKIKSSIQDLIRTNSIARIGTLGLLGDKYVAISLGEPKFEVLKDNQYIASTNPIDFEEFISRGITTVDDVTAAVGSFKEIAAKINRGEGTIAKMVNDPKMYESMVKSWEILTKLGEKVEKNEGTVGLLFNDTTLYYETGMALREIAALADTLKRGEGTLKMLLRDTTLYHQMISTVHRIDSLIAQIQSGEGTTGELISSAELYMNLNNAIETRFVDWRY